MKNVIIRAFEAKKKIFSLAAAALMSATMSAQKAQVWDLGAEQPEVCCRR